MAATDDKRQSLPNIRQSLPIDPHLEKIAGSFLSHPNLVLTASPGSGKTTRVPPLLASTSAKKTIVLVPKRIAAVSAAARVAEENGWALGQEAGYQVRFDNRTNSSTKLIYMTEGVFLKKIADEKFWNEISVLVFDEFHERSSAIDLALGAALEKQISGSDIKLLVMSATLNAQKILEFLPDSRWIQIEDRPFPLHVVKSKKSQRLQCDQLFADHLADTLQAALSQSRRDTLVFLPGLGEIRFVERNLLQKFKNFEIAVLHGSIKLEEQRRIVQPGSGRRIILSTNIAESSITIPSVDLVIDSGLEKKSVTESKIGFKRLELVRISQFSAAQRAGRAARTSEGFCFELWHEIDERSMPVQNEPEILTSDLLDETLTLLSFGVSEPDKFSWLDKPKKPFKPVIEQMKVWQLLDEKNMITAKGRLVQSCPLDTEKAVLFVSLCERGFQREASKLLAFTETANFDKQNESIDLQRIPLSDMGQRIENQLLSLSVAVTAKSSAGFKETLISVYFKFFPHKIAKKKEKNFAVSSLGRGLELSPYLVNKDSDYYLLMSGRELSSALTKCDFAVGFSQEEFARLTSTEIKTVSEMHLDLESRRIYKVEKKMAGYFEVSSSAKQYVDEKKEPQAFRHFMDSSFEELLSDHNDYKNYVTKINFLKKKSELLGLSESHFAFLSSLAENVKASAAETSASIAEFYSSDLFSLLLFFTPEDIRELLQSLPGSFKLPSGKQIPVDYESEQAPKLSAKLQEFFGVKTNPSLLNGRIRMTIEMLAPNYRPTQVTSQLENFWSAGYHEIKKELKARYPKHAWPDDPVNYVPEKKK
jgi:ATP-dependent helicase HrpB